MAAKKTKANSKSKGSSKSGGSSKKSVSRKAVARPKRAVAKTKIAIAGSAKQAIAKNAKPTNGANGKPVAANGKPAVPTEPEKIKKKPPSITITRPEMTRPPAAQLPPPRVDPPIIAPSILLPKGGLPISSLTPILRWMYVGGATRYEVEWSPDAHFGRGHSITVVATQTAITVGETHELKPSTNYKWRVRGGNDLGWGPWSAPESFRSPERQFEKTV